MARLGLLNGKGQVAQVRPVSQLAAPAGHAGDLHPVAPVPRPDPHLLISDRRRCHRPDEQLEPSDDVLAQLLGLERQGAAQRHSDDEKDSEESSELTVHASRSRECQILVARMISARV
jgi:hypothetical protein